MNTVKVGKYFLMEVPDAGFNDHPVLTLDKSEALALTHEEASDWASELGGSVGRK
jgi:hypothetical protein